MSPQEVHHWWIYWHWEGYGRKRFGQRRGLIYATRPEPLGLYSIDNRTIPSFLHSAVWGCIHVHFFTDQVANVEMIQTIIWFVPRTTGVGGSYGLVLHVELIKIWSSSSNFLWRLVHESFSSRLAPPVRLSISETTAWVSIFHCTWICWIKVGLLPAGSWRVGWHWSWVNIVAV